MTTLTNTAIDALPVGKELKDDRVPGLSVRRHATGASFMLYYRTKTGLVRRPKLGAYPVLSIAQAREIARGELAKVAAGEDPVAARTLARGEPTMDDLAERCEREHYNSDSEWHKEALRLYRRNASPHMGKTRVRAVDYAAVHAVHARFAARPVEGNRTVAVLSRMLNLAERWGWRDTGSNPCQHVERYPELKRRRYAKPAEIAEIGKVLDAYAEDPEHLTGVAFLYLMMFSGARPSEIANGTPDMIERVERDGVVMGVLRIDHGKTGQRDVFLPPQAMRVLDKLPADRKRLAGRRTVPRRLWEIVREKVGCSDLWVRDMRRTFATVGLSAGMDPGRLAELLGHKSVQTTKIYAKLIEDAAHAATAAIAGRMEQMLGGGK